MVVKFILLLGMLLPSLGTASELYTDEQCLTATVFFEARAESIKGQKAVADVVINRTKHSAFKHQDTVCKVVFAPSQFSWVKSDPKRARRLINGDLRGLNASSVSAYRKANQIATEALSEGYKSVIPSHVVSFHNSTVTPAWSKTMRLHGKIGSHYFYSFTKRKL